MGTSNGEGIGPEDTEDDEGFGDEDVNQANKKPIDAEVWAQEVMEDRESLVRLTLVTGDREREKAQEEEDKQSTGGERLYARHTERRDFEDNTNVRETNTPNNSNQWEENTAVQGCTKLYKVVHGCTSLSIVIHGCAMFYIIVGKLKLLDNVIHSCTWLYKVVHGLYTVVQGCT